MRRRSFLAASTLGALAIAACRKKQPPQAAPAPPARPSDVLGEIVVRDPPGSWGRVRAIVGLASLTMPRTAFGLITRALDLHGLEEKVEPSRPIVAVIVGEAVVSAWGVEDAAKLGTFAPERFELSQPIDSTRWLRAKAGAQPLPVPLGVRDRFLLTGSNEALIASHGDYLLRGLAVQAMGGGPDLVLEVTKEGAGSPGFAKAITELDPLVAALDTKDESAPSQLPAVVKALGAALALVKKKPSRVEVTLAAASVDVLVIPSEGAKTNIEIPDTVVRYWIRKRMGL